ncbi:hypothetical protein Tco_0488619 [Tanacetum coccineum]
MAESSLHNTSSPEITPKEEPITLDKPESPNPFLPSTQVEFTFEEIAFTTNNEVLLLYPSHPNQEYFKDVSEFISKCCLKEAFTRALTQYKECLRYSREIREKGTLKKNCLPPRWRLLMGQIIQCLGGKTSGLDQISNKDATILFISLLLENMMPEYDNEDLIINPTQVFSVYNWTLKPNQPKEPPFTAHMKAICKLDVLVVSKAPKPSSQTEEVPQGKNPRAKSGLRRKQSSKHTSESQTKASKSKTGQSETKTKSSSATDKSPSHPSPPTLVVGEMHKEAQQAAGDPTSLGATSKKEPTLSSVVDMNEGTKNYSFDHIFAGSNPSVLVDKTKSARNGLKIAHTDLDKSEKEEAVKEDTHDTFHDMPEDTSVPPHPSLKSSQIQELMAQVQLLKSQKDELEQQKVTAKAEVASLKARPSYPDVNQLTTLLIKELKQHVKDMEIELPGDLKEIPTKLEIFTSTISSLTFQKQLKNLDSLPSLLNMVTKTLNRFATMVENSSKAMTKDVPSAGQATTSPAEGEKNTKDAKTNLNDELVDLLGINFVT